MAKPYRNLRKRIRVSPEARAEIAAHKAAMEDALRLAEIRELRGLTQAQLAEALEVTQRRVSSIEHQTDLYLSTLRDYVEMLGGELEVVAVFPEQRVPIVVTAG